MKKLFTLLLVLLFVVTGLAGCSRTPTAVPYDEVRMDEWEEMTLEYWCTGNVQQVDKEVEAAANEILKKHLPNTSVHFTWIPIEEYWDRTNRAFAADENIDILNNMLSARADYAKKRARTGNFINLTPYYDTYMADYAAHIGEDMRKLYQTDGKDYFFLTKDTSLPTFHTVEASVQLLTELGYDPQEWKSSIEQLAAEAHQTRSLESEEKLLGFFEEYCEKMEQSGFYANDPFGSINVNAPYAIYQSKFSPGKVAAHHVGAHCNIPLFLIPVGVDVNNKDFELEVAATSDQMKFYWQKAAEWYERGWIREDIAKYFLQDNSQDFEHSQYKSGEQHYRNYKLDMNFHFKEADTYDLFQNAPNEELLVVGARMVPTDHTVLQASCINGIPKTVKKNGGLERALIFQNFLYTEASQEYSRTILYGRETLEWTWNDDRKDDTSTVYLRKNPNGSMFYYKGGYLFGSELNRLNEPPQPLAEYVSIADYKDASERIKNAWVDPYYSFRLDLSDETYASIYEKVGIIYDDYAVEFWNGSLGTDGLAKAYSEMEQRLKDVGIDKLKAEALRQLRAYAKDFSITTGWEKGY